MKTLIKYNKTGYPFGMVMPGRSVSLAGYRFGFNGKENDNEVKGNANQQDYGMRLYDPRIGRFLSIDPLASKFPFYTPFQFSGNSPIVCIDIDGLENIYYGEGLKFNESSAMIIANNSTVYNDLVKQFQNTSSSNNQEVNVGWDLLIIKAPTASSEVGANTANITTDQLLIRTPKELNGYEKIVESIKNDPNKKGLIVVVIREEKANAADIVAGQGNWETAASVASDLDHELDCHVIDIALGRPNRNSDEQHIDYYSQKGKPYVPLQYNESPPNAGRDYPNSRGGMTEKENKNISKQFTGKKFDPIQKITPITDVQISK